jgi:hypothetical protein
VVVFPLACSWVNRGERSWTSDRPRRRRSRAKPAGELEREQEGVIWAPLTCPRCGRYDQVRINTTRDVVDIRVRYARCGRCDITIKAVEP